MKQEQGMFSAIFLSNNQSTHSRFVSSHSKWAEAEGGFEERFSETVRQFPVIYDKGYLLVRVLVLSCFP